MRRGCSSFVLWHVTKVEAKCYVTGIFPVLGNHQILIRDCLKSRTRKMEEFLIRKRTNGVFSIQLMIEFPAARNLILESDWKYICKVFTSQRKHGPIECTTWIIFFDKNMLDLAKFPIEKYFFPQVMVPTTSFSILMMVIQLLEEWQYAID